ncbi:FitA-like ribbon-helix-helix domain-containing protein [Microbacterium panaciterrae]|uniref:Antitoxin FitA-like ribbon-helix-helix domain-containing protein n=1 Tax=Microbacterium panaciterrae TaxID=985759 RepID=A0ABP8PFI8_9MICO
MAQLLIRNLPDEVKAALRRRAHDNGRSMEAEARAILVDLVLPRAEDPVLLWLEDADDLRERGLGSDLPEPQRSAPRLAVTFE